MPEPSVPEQGFLYWLLTAAFIALGVFAIPSIGLYLLPIGVSLLVLGIKGRPGYGFWPPIFGVVLFFASFNLIGFAPPFWLTILVSVVIGIGGAFLLRLALLRLGGTRYQLNTPPPGEESWPR